MGAPVQLAANSRQEVETLPHHSYLPLDGYGLRVWQYPFGKVTSNPYSNGADVMKLD